MSSPPPVGKGADLVATTVRFCQALRDRGVAATPADAVTATRALEVTDLSDRAELYLALRATLVRRVEEYPAFDALFDEFWGDLRPVPKAGHGPGNPAVPESAERREKKGRSREGAPAALEEWLRKVSDEAEPIGAPAFGEEEGRGKRDFAAFGDQELEEIARVAARMARRLAARPGRRWEPVRRGPRVHPRRSVRRALRTGGDLVELAYRRRKPRKTSLVLLCDVSGSMELYTRFLLQFLYALQNRFSRVETFVFSTRLSRVTDDLRGPSYREALDRVSAGVRGWAGGTRIGESLAEFDREWSRLLDRRTAVVVLSDGWDTGEPEVLGEALRSIRRRAGKVIWLNPLLGSPGYQPLTRGMQAALPHVDLFAPAHNLESLRALVRELVP